MTQYPFSRALVTGASSGIGEAIAHELGTAGVALVLVARREDRLQELAARYPGSEVLAADLQTPEGRSLVEQRLASEDEPVDLLVNNAGFGTSGAFATLDADRVQGEIELNITALTRLTRAALPRMQEAGRGWVLNVASVVAFQPAPYLNVYAATKAYVQSFSDGLHEELRGTGVTVTSLCPGLTKTEFQSVSNTSHYTKQYPAIAWLTAERVAREGLADCVRGKALSVPGAQYKGMVAIAGVMPRRLLRRISGLVQRG
jgi:short-subunit dehydrogenase